MTAVRDEREARDTAEGVSPAPRAGGGDGGPEAAPTRWVSGLFADIEPQPLERPLAEALAAGCQEIATLLDAPVVTVYACEEDEAGPSLMVRANLGFRINAVGHLRLRAGEGIVGHVAETGVAVTTEAAESDAHFRWVRGLGEKKFPVLLASPIVRAGRCLGVLVLQRRPGSLFAASDMRLANVLAAGVGLLLEAGQKRQRLGDGDAPASAFLRGERCAGGGIAIGQIEILPGAHDEHGGSAADAGATARALARIEGALEKVAERASPEAAAASDHLALVLSDSRLRERILAGDSLETVARDYARATHAASPQSGPDEAMRARARDIEELCAVLADLRSQKRLLRGGVVWIGEYFGGFAAAVSSKRAAAVLLEGESVVTPEARAIAETAHLPVLCAVSGLFAWARRGDLVLVDGDRASVRLNPGAGGLVDARAAKQR